jgi:hypothetical protein
MSTNPAVTRVVGVVQKAADLQTHIRIVEIDNVRVLEFRDFIPSLSEYGRGYWVPMTESAVYGILTIMNETVSTEVLA